MNSQKIKDGLVKPWLRENTNSCCAAGFTLIEILIVVAISAIISAVGGVSVSNYNANRNLESAVSKISAAVYETQNRSITQKDGNQWGIRFQNSTTTGDKYQIFSGATFSISSTSETYSFKGKVQFSEPPQGNVLDVVFSAISGKYSQKKIISLVTGRNDGLVGDVMIDTNGRTITKLEKNLVGYWHFDEGTSTTAYDASGRGNSGTLISSPTWQTAANCKVGGCLSFNGTNNYVNVGTGLTLDITGPLTVTAWVKRGVAGSQHSIVGKWDWSGGDYRSYYLQVFSDNLVDFFLSSNGTDGGTTRLRGVTTLSAGQWYYLVGVYDGAAMRLYVNGVLDNSTSYSSGVYSRVATPVVVGIQNSPSPASYFNGTIDEVRIYSRALTAQEVLDQYNDYK